jgi:hypothetical protein
MSAGLYRLGAHSRRLPSFSVKAEATDTTTKSKSGHIPFLEPKVGGVKGPFANHA